MRMSESVKSNDEREDRALRKGQYKRHITGRIWQTWVRTSNTLQHLLTQCQYSIDKVRLMGGNDGLCERFLAYHSWP